MPKEQQQNITLKEYYENFKDELSDDDISENEEVLIEQLDILEPEEIFLKAGEIEECEFITIIEDQNQNELTCQTEMMRADNSCKKYKSAKSNCDPLMLSTSKSMKVIYPTYNDLPKRVTRNSGKLKFFKGN